jgi:hypothetical protein
MSLNKKVLLLMLKQFLIVIVFLAANLLLHDLLDLFGVFDIQRTININQVNFPGWSLLFEIISMDLVIIGIGMVIYGWYMMNKDYLGKE